MKGVALVVFGVIGLLFALPIVAIVSVTNVGALNNSDVTLYQGPAYPGDTYDFGNCTFWAAMRRAQVGESIPDTWGNAATWAIRAMFGGYKVDHTPTKYAIMQTPDSAGGLGHVAFVESVDPNGTWHISEMNATGFDEVDNKPMPASAAKNYSFIHEKE